MSEHGSRQWIADGDPQPLAQRGAMGHHGPDDYATCSTPSHWERLPQAVCSVCRQPDPEGAHRHASE